VPPRIETGMWIAEIWRYPVKSMAGENLQRAEIRRDGIRGDRVVHVGDGRGRMITARTRPRLLLFRATLGADGEPLVDGRPWRSEEVAREVRAAAGGAARLERYDGPERFDVLPLLVATDGAIAAFGFDRRRLRPNLVIGGVEGLAERGWEGCVLRAGTARIAVRDLRQRCVMTTFDPDSVEQDARVLRRIHREFGGLLALNCHVLQEGAVTAGDPVELLDGASSRRGSRLS
jgi:hypothetical protein